MKTLLVIDTATDICTVACRHQGRVLQDTRSVHRSHNTELLGMIDALFRRASLAPREIDALGFVAGPGSFTGIRIAAAVSQALAHGSDAVLLALNSAELLAATVAQREQNAANAHRHLVTVLPSRRDRYYCAQFPPLHDAPPGALPKASVENRLLDGKQVAAEVRGLLADRPLTVAIGRGVDDAGLAELFALDAPPGGALHKERLAVSSEALLDFANARFLQQDALDRSSSAAERQLAGLPIYVEGDTPWRPK